MENDALKTACENNYGCLFLFYFIYCFLDYSQLENSAVSNDDQHEYKAQVLILSLNYFNLFSI